MSKEKQEAAGALLSENQIAQNQAANEENAELPLDLRQNPPPPTPPQAPPVEGSKGKGEPVKPSLMTVDQYLKWSPKGAGINGLIKSLYKIKVMSFEDWEKTVKSLLEKPVK